MNTSRNMALFGALVVLGCIVFLVFGFAQLPDFAMGRHGWIALALGTVFSVVVGGGLAAILIISRRRGYDEAAHDASRGDEPDL